MPDKYIILTLVAIATLQISNNFQKQEQNTFKTKLSFKKFLFSVLCGQFLSYTMIEGPKS